MCCSRTFHILGYLLKTNGGLAIPCAKVLEVVTASAIGIFVTPHWPLTKFFGPCLRYHDVSHIQRSPSHLTKRATVVIVVFHNDAVTLCERTAGCLGRLLASLELGPLSGVGSARFWVSPISDVAVPVRCNTPVADPKLNMRTGDFSIARSRKASSRKTNGARTTTRSAH